MWGCAWETQALVGGEGIKLWPLLLAAELRDFDEQKRDSFPPDLPQSCTCVAAVFPAIAHPFRCLAPLLVQVNELIKGLSHLSLLWVFVNTLDSESSALPQNFTCRDKDMTSGGKSNKRKGICI
jgi:hypothetical protein